MKNVFKWGCVLALFLATASIVISCRNLRAGSDEPPQRMELVFYQQGKIYAEEIIVGPKFSRKELVRATNAFMFVKALIEDTSMYPDFGRFYWATNFELCDGITTGNRPGGVRFVIIDHINYPESNDTEGMFEFGKILVHETAHLSHNLSEHEVLRLVDEPAEAAFLALKTRILLYQKSLINTNKAK